jgi:hypothetical protein
MPQKLRTRLIEVSVSQLGRHAWEWCTHSDGEVLVRGVEKTQVAASFAGYNAMFLILASGWNS